MKIQFILVAILIIAQNIEAQQNGTFIDSRDSKTYKTVTIGNQVWMAENLNYDAGSSCWCYNDNSNNCAKYGRLYTYKTAKNVCPSGWHLPSKAEFETLLNKYGSEENAYTALEESGRSGFNALYGGGRGGGGSYEFRSWYGYFWSSSEDDSDVAWYMGIFFTTEEAYMSHDFQSWGFSVRCVQD